MAIHSLASGSDPRVVCGVLAREALKAFQHQAPPSDQSRHYVFFTNLIRLLELYRYDLFSDFRPRGILVREHSDRPSGQAATAENMNAVRDALQAAHRQVFGNQSIEEVVEFLQAVLAAVRDGDDRPPADVAKVREFIESFGEHLKG